MRRAILLGLVLAVVPGVAGAQRVTVHQLEQILGSPGPAPGPQAEGLGPVDLLDQINREDSLAPRLAALELTERLTNVDRARLAAQYNLGPLTKSALELLADRSAFLDPPANEFLALPPPDADQQHTMVRQAGEFVFKTLTHLPDFFALLTTTHFDDGPVVIEGQTLATDPGMHRVGASEREITFSDGKEVYDSSRGRLGRRAQGLDSQGEFGAEAATVMLDLQHGTLWFHHWEKSELGTVAVFRYAVPKENSHYEVKYACADKASFHAQPGYHGALAIDPASGVLVRFTLQTESSPGDPIAQVASAIDYGSVVLGDRRYLCPVRSLAFSVEVADSCHKHLLTRPIAMMNRIIFTDYHRLGSEMVIVPGEQQPVKPGDLPAGAEPPRTPPPPVPTPASHAPASAAQPAPAKSPKK